VCVSLLGALTTIVTPLAPSDAAGVGTLLFQNAFNDRTVDGTGTVTVPIPASGANTACLTAKGNSATLPLLSCAGNIDLQGLGKLRLTDTSTNQVGGIFGQNSFPSSNGLDVTFNSYQWGGGNADGIAFMLAAVDPANPVAPTTMGPSGGSLGYARAGSVNGLKNAYLGVGLDVFGNFSSSNFTGTGCATNPDFTLQRAGAVAVRGPGTGTVGYCGLTTTSDGTLATKLILRAATRGLSVVPVQVLINPTPSSFTSESGVSVAAGTYKVVVKPVGQLTHTLSGPLPAAPSGLYPSSSWITSAGVPKQLSFGFVGSTGSVTDNHEISDVKVLTFDPVPQLSVSSTTYAAATSQPGDPVNYRITPSVDAGADETSPVSVTQTVPTGVVPVGAYGTGWVCQSPIGLTITCTTTASSFANGTTLPLLNVVAIATGSGVTSAFVQTNSTSNVSSVDAGPGTDTTATAGTLPTTPAAITVTPSIGSVSGGAAVTIGGTNITSATAIEIGTSSEQQAGTPVVLLPCPGAAAAGCFTVSGSTLKVSSWPSRASAASTNVTVVTSGVAASAAYVYADKPTAPAIPTATPGILSATVNWTAPASNGSVITGYTITPYLANVAQTAQSFDASTTTRTLTGLTAGGAYTFTVAATNAFGTSAPSAKSVAVVPYTLPGAPTITAVSAGSNSATLTFNAPSTGGSTITGYVVTPFIGAVAQATQSFSGTSAPKFVTGLTAGTAYTFTIAAQNLAGTGPPSARSSAVTPNVSPSLTFTAPPAGEVGIAYSRLLTVTNGTSPFTWSVSAGSLPDGLILNASTGLLSGTPTTAGSFGFTVQVTDASGATATKVVTLVIVAAPSLSFTPTAGEVGVSYSQQPSLSGGTGPFVWSVSSGSLPAGVSLNATTGLLSGTPTAAGAFALSIQVSDAFGQTATKTVTLTILAPPAFVATAPHTGQVGVTYSHSFDVTGGSLPLTWSISAGSLPPGLALNPGTGGLSGTPTTIGSYPFTVSVIDANGQVATRSVTAVIGAGPIVITKTANVSSAAAGSVVDYTITINNTGSSAFNGIALTDPLSGVLDDASYNGDALATGGTVSYTSPSLGWSGNVAAGATVTLTYSVTIASPVLGNKVLSNTVTSSTLGTNCAASSSDPLCSSTVTVPGLVIVKSADVATTNPGHTVHYTIQVSNTGQTPYVGASLTDNLAGNLDDAAYNGDAGATSGSVSYSSPGLTWTGNLAVGASVTITYSVTVGDPDTGNKVLTGSVTSSSPGSPCPSIAPAAQCSTSVTVLVPALVVTNTFGASSTTPGSTVPFTVTLSNTGQTAYTAIASTLSLAGALDDATYEGDATTTSGSVAFDPATSTLTWSGGIPIGGVVTIIGSVTVHDPDSGNKSLTTVAASSAPGSTCPTGSTNSSCSSTVTVLIPQLTITKAANQSTSTPGSIVEYTTSVTNTGQTAYTGAAFTEALDGVLDDATYANNASATVGSVSFAGSTVSWSGNLAVGATATVTYSVTVHDPDTGDRSLASRVVSSTAGNNCRTASTDARCSTAIGILVPALAIVQSADVTTAVPGQVLHLMTTVTNTGQTSYANAEIVINFAGATDDVNSNSDVDLSTGSLAVSATDATWTLSLAPGASATASVAVTVIDPPTGDKLIRTSTTSTAAGSTCPVGNSLAACHNVVSVLVPGLTITKTATSSTAQPGDTVGYTIVVRNDGETPYAAANISDDLTHVLTDATYGADATASSGDLSYASSVLTWTGALAQGASATISFTVTVRDPDPGDKLMANVVRSTTAGSNCATSSTDPRCTAIVTVLVPALTIAETANAATSVPGATVTHTIKVTNSGATTYTAATLSNSLAGVLDDATYNDDASATTGTAGVSGGVLTWTGALAPGASATITYTVTVHAADGGNNLVTSVITSTSTGSNCPTGGSDARCTVVVPIARLLLTQAYEHPTTTPGSVIRLNGTFTNTGKVPYTGITVTSPSAGTVDDAIPAGDQTATSGTLTLTSTAISWTGSIPVGGVVNVTGTLTVKDPDTGDKAITGTLVSSAPGNTCPSSGGAPLCTALTTVQVPQLTITKVADRTAVLPGGHVAYTVTVHNTGETAYAAASVTDALSGVLDKSSYDGNAATTSGSVELVGSTLTWTGALAAGATATVTYSVTIPASPTGDKTLINSVSSTDVGSTCVPGSGLAACRSTVVILTPALTIVKTADQMNATLGSTVTYTVKATNTGQTPYSAAAFNDSLAGLLDDATYVSASTTSGTVGFNSGVLSWSGALAPGSSATITYSVTINNPDTGDRSMSNIVTSSTPGNNCQVGSTDTRCAAIVAVTNSVSLTMTKAAASPTTVAGGIVHYTLTIANSSESDVTDANLSDPWGGITDDATYNHDASPSAGTVDDTGSGLTWSGTVPALSTITITYAMTVHTAVTGDQILDGTISSTTDPTSNNCVADSTDPRCTSTVTVSRLSIQQHYSETTTTPGSVAHLTATFTNTGKTPYNGITVASPAADTLDDAVTNGDETASSGVLTLSAAGISWTGNVPVGATITIQGTVTVQNPDPGNRLLTGTLSSAAPGNNCAAASVDPLCTAALPVKIPQLTISKTANTTFVVPGGTATYTITVHNTGETAYVGATASDTLIGVLDDATLNGGITASIGSVTYSSPVLTWTGDLAIGETATVTYSVIARSPATADKTMVNPVSSTTEGSTCPPAAASAACHTTVAVLTPALTITSSANHTQTMPGQTVTYTVVATNSGQLPFGSADLNIALGDLLDDATYAGGISASSGTPAVVGNLLTWRGALSPGGSVTITYAVTVAAAPAGNHRLGQTITSVTPGSNCATGSADSRCTTSVPIASLHITQGANVAETLPTGVVVLSSTITNTGQVPYTGISVLEDLAGAIDDFTYNGDGAASSGSLVFSAALPEATWTGDVPVGATVTVTGSGTINDPDTGDKNVHSIASTDAVASNCPVGGSDSACEVNIPVRTPGLTITTAADSTTATPGAIVTYEVTVTNSGETDYSGATIASRMAGVLDDADYSGDVSVSRGAASFTGEILTWTGDLDVGQSATITYSVHVDAIGTGDGSMVEVVTSDELGSTCPSGNTNPACESTVIVLVPALDLALSADRTTTEPGGSVGYVVTITNSGQTDYIGASVTTALAGVVDDAASPDHITTSLGTAEMSGTDLAWTGDIAMGVTVEISYSVVVDDPALGDRSMTTTVRSAAPGSSCGTTATCVNTVTVLIPGLHIATTADVSTATPGSSVEFTITIDNTGQTPYVGTVVAASLSGALDDADFDGTVNASRGVASYAAPTISWTGSLAAGASARVTYRVVVKDPAAGNRSISTTVVGTAAGSNCQVGSADPACEASVTVLVPQLTILKTAGAPTSTPGSVVHYSIVVTNTGQTSYSGAVVNDDLGRVLPDAAYDGNASVVGGGVLFYADSTLTWTGDLAIGASATIAYSVTIDDPDHGDKLMVNSVTSTEPGSTCPPDGSAPACTAVVRILVPGLLIEKSADTSTVVAGDAVTYTITVTNTGQTNYQPARLVDPLADVLDDATYDGHATATAGSTEFDDGSLVWTGPLDVGETAVITYTVTTKFPATGDHSLVNVASSTSPGANCAGSGAPLCSSTVTVLVPALDIEKSASTTEVTAGGRMTYTILATNSGQADYSAAQLTDSLADVLDDAVYDDDAAANTGNVGFLGETLTWNGSLARGATLVITYSVAVPLESTGDGLLVNSVASSSTGATCTPTSLRPACTTSTTIAARTITLTGLTSSFTLTGLPNTTVSLEEAVAMTVTTNSTTGYTVSVLADSPWLSALSPLNNSVIDIARMRVRESGTSSYQQMSADSPVVVHTQSTPSSPQGDAVSNDFQLDIPFVPSDTYSNTLDYIAATQ
jgi:uncharacterized repeat protein (TIGR01451 family)